MEFNSDHSVSDQLHNRTNYIRFYHLRTFDRINAPYGTFIKEMERNSGIEFSQVQVALAREWVGPDDGSWRQPDIKLKAPGETSGTPADLGTTAKKAENIKTYPFPATVEEARDTISRFEDGAPRSDQEVADTIGQHALQDGTDLRDEKWLGSPEEERDRFVFLI